MEAAVLETPSMPAEPASGSSGSHSQLDRLVALYRRASRALRANDPANWADRLTMPQIRALFFVGRSGVVSVGHAAAGLGISQPSATEMLEKLVCRNLVERTADPSDRRIVRIGLTDKGQEMIDRPWETRRAVLASALRDASPDERAAMERGLALLCEALEKAERTVAVAEAREEQEGTERA